MVTNRRTAAIIADLWRRNGYRPPVRCDTLATDTGLSFAEAWSLAARHLARTGRARQAEAVLRSGTTVRALLRALYGVKTGPAPQSRRDPGAAVRTYHEGLSPTLKTGIFYLAGNRNFLFGSDRSYVLVPLAQVVGGGPPNCFAMC
jgi:hypothetical protein